MTPRVRLLLALLLVAAAAAAWWRATGSSGGLIEAVAGQSGRSRPPAFTAEEVPVVSFAEARPYAGEVFTSIRQNLFVYEKSPETLAVEKAAAEKAAAEAAIAAAAAEEARKQQAIIQAKIDEENRKRAEEEEKERKLHPPPPPPPVPPEFLYQWVGKIGPDDSPYAILQNAAKEYSFAKAGDVIDNQFRVERVGLVHLDLSYVDPRFTGQFKQVDEQLPAAPPPSAPDSGAKPTTSPYPRRK